ncbi:ABC transporter substrate-binding protein [Pseudalkalibacillus decolorationis]|uniref:ABC transporter substrate-binding protein n=1 Tax=Pseudalkalibacillus decolorationis TaxID=163879 RepID=UPI002148FA37|nr:sugar ABC transporter substrate-binding protein [Pseudalkalibacillus decolorationis]
MKKFKIVRMVAILGLMMTLLITGCSNSDAGGESTEGKTVKVLLSAGDVGQFNAWKARSKEFTERTGIKIKFIETPYENLLEEITADGIAMGGAYDLVAHLDTMGSSINQFLEPLDQYVERDNFNVDRWPEASVDRSTFDGKLYSLPVRAHAQMLFYRKDIFEQLGLEPPKTWADLEAASKKITDETDLYGIVPYYGAGHNGQNLFMWTSYLWSNGGKIFNEDLNPVFNSPKGLEATQRYIDLLVTDKVAPPGSVTFGEQDSRTYFKQGKAAMWIGWWWVYSEFNDSEASAPEVVGNVDFATVPGWEGKGSVPSITTFPLGMMKGSKNKEAAWEVLKWLSDPELELDIVMDTLKGESPSNQKSIVITQTENLRNKELNKLTDGFYNVAADNLENAKTLPKMKEWPRVSDIISSAISKIATGEPVEPTLNEAAEQVEKLLEESGYYD